MYGIPGMIGHHRGQRDWQGQDYRGRDDYRYREDYRGDRRHGGQLNIPGIPGGIQLPREFRRMMPNIGQDRNFDGRPDFGDRGRDQRRFDQRDPRGFDPRDPRGDMRRPDMRDRRFDQQPDRQQQMLRDQAARDQAIREQLQREQAIRRGQGQGFVPPPGRDGRAIITQPPGNMVGQPRREVMPQQVSPQQQQHHQRRDMGPPPGADQQQQRKFAPPPMQHQRRPEFVPPAGTLSPRDQQKK